MSKLKTPYCPLNGRHGMVNGAAPAFPIEDCRFCQQSNLVNYNQYCPNCHRCFTCERIIKSKYSQLKDV